MTVGSDGKNFIEQDDNIRLVGSQQFSAKNYDFSNIGKCIEEAYQQEIIAFKEKEQKKKNDDEDSFYGKASGKEKEIILQGKNKKLDELIKDNPLHKRNLENNLNSFQKGLATTTKHRYNKSIELKLNLGKLIQKPNENIKIEGFTSTKNLNRVNQINKRMHLRTKSTQNQELFYHLNDQNDEVNKFTVKQKFLSKRLNDLSELMKKKYCINNNMLKNDKKKEEIVEKEEMIKNKKDLFYLKQNEVQSILPPNALMVKEFGYFQK